MRRPLILLACLTAVAAVGAGLARAGAAEERFETADWIFVAPSEVGSAADLALTGRAVQLCTDELRKLIGYRPAKNGKFTMQWVPSAASGAGATQTGVFNWYAPGFRVVDESTRGFRESLVAQGLCFGPHEVTHVLSWDSFRIAWANEGFAEYTDRLYDSASWRCCAQPPPASFRCDETGYSRWSERTAYSDLSPFVRSSATYTTAACFWWEAQRLGGFAGLRALLASMRIRPPLTTGELVVQHANVVLGTDMRGVLLRYGFATAELAAPPPPAAPRVCTRLGTDAADVLEGTTGPDVLCGAAGADRLTGRGGPDVFRAGAGNDVLQARDGVADAVACGPGRDSVTADRRDRVNRDCERVRRS
jgi:hemolysin type calcium-binding protein